jgi:hypothetical protein
VYSAPLLPLARHHRGIAAPEYVDLLFQWVEQQLGDESLFPTDPAKP